MRLTKNRELNRKRSKVAELSQWLTNHPREKYKVSSSIIEAFLDFKEGIPKRVNE